MPKKIAVSTLNASTIDILNVIRQNASEEYQNLVPEVKTANDIPKVGEVLYGYPAMANQFLSALVNRIAQVRVNSATFNNPYVDLKKGLLEFGESVEEIFVNIAKGRTFNPEKAPQREFARSLPDVRSTFHVMNWSVQYPVTISEAQLQKAFLTMDGVQDLIARIVDSVYKAAEYDEYLLFKYLIIKAVAHGKMYPIAIGTPTSQDMSEAAIAFRANSNQITFLSQQYNDQHVHTNTPKDKQYIFMDSQFNAQYDVNVLAAAFNMDKADFSGHLKLIDSWTTFDNERFDIIRSESNMIEEVTAEELALMTDVKAVLVDAEWFQVYDNVMRFTEKFVASGDYWNYFYRVEKTISSSPFSNALVFVEGSAAPVMTSVANLTGTIVNKAVDPNGPIVMSVGISEPAGLAYNAPVFIQTKDATEKGIAIHRYGTVIFPQSGLSTTLACEINGTLYTATAATPASANVGATITFSPPAGN